MGQKLFSNGLRFNFLDLFLFVLIFKQNSKFMRLSQHLRDSLEMMHCCGIIIVLKNNIKLDNPIFRHNLHQFLSSIDNTAMMIQMIIAEHLQHRAIAQIVQ